MAKKSSIDWDSVGLGEKVDAEIAKELWVTVSNVAIERRKRNIPPYRKWRNTKSYDDIDWEKQPLGEMPDREIAEQLGVPHYVVRKRRQSMGISGLASRKKLYDHIDFDNKRDVDIAKELGVSRERVRQIRSRMGIEAFCKRRYKEMTEALDDIDLLGKMTDSEISRLTGFPRVFISSYRNKKNIPTYFTKNAIIDRISDDEWSTMTNGQIASKYDVSSGHVSILRRKFNKPKHNTCYRKGIDWDAEDLLGKVSDSVLAKKHGVSRNTVLSARIYRNIPAYKKEK